MRRIWRVLRAVICALTWLALLYCGLVLLASIDYYLDLPELYAVYDYVPDRMDDLKLKAVIWLAVSGFWFLLAGAVCGASTYGLWKHRNENTGQTPVGKR